MYHYQRLTDIDTIKTVMTDEEMWERISEDGQDRNDFEALIDDSFHWIGLYCGDILFGISLIHPHNTSTGVAHINILKPYRRDHGLQGGLMSLQYATGLEYHKYIAEVADVYPEVVGFIKKLGFIQEGLNRKSIMKGGKLVDQIWFGASITEIQTQIYNLIKELQ